MNSLSIHLWSARITASLSSLFILFFLLAHLFGTGEKSLLEITEMNELILFMFFPVITLVGLLVGLKNPLIGGIVTLMGIAGFHVIGDYGSWTIIDAFAIPGVLFLAYVWRKSNS